MTAAAGACEPDAVTLVDGVEECAATIVQTRSSSSSALAFWGVGRVVLLCCRATDTALVADAVPAGVQLLGCSDAGDTRGLRFAVDRATGRVASVHDAAGCEVPVVRVARVPWDRVVLVLDATGAVLSADIHGPLGAVRLGTALLAPIPSQENDQDNGEDDDDGGPAIETLAKAAAATGGLEGVRVVPAQLLPRVRTLTNVVDTAQEPLLHARLLCYAPRGTPARAVACLCARHLARRTALARTLAATLEPGAAPLETRLVCAPPLPCALELPTPAMPRLVDSPALSGTRRALQDALGLGTTRPRLHPRASEAAAAETSLLADIAGVDETRAAFLRAGHLLDVGAELVAQGSGAPGCARAGVAGRYAYYHYGQDGVRDGGWGCAYRALQTLWSWLRLQRCTAAPVPTHRDVQARLVALGDKPRAFVGSRAWLGAVEVALCLQAGAGVDCRVLHVPRGADVPAHAPELAAHFRAEGTPVMVGGGVLAYTVLGIEWPSAAADGGGATSGVRFLILDPHYTGPDTAREVLRRGGCAWRAAEDVFRADCFYNFCMPLVPRTF